MTPRARELLLKMVSFYDSNNRNDFPALFYCGYEDSVIKELVSLGCIVKLNDSVGTIKLTYTGYDIAMEMRK